MLQPKQWKLAVGKLMVPDMQQYVNTVLTSNMSVCPHARCHLFNLASHQGNWGYNELELYTTEGVYKFTDWLIAG
jgi:hypothetical protein